VLPAYIKESKQGVEISIHVVPGAKKSELIGLHGTSLKIRVSAPPIEGRANEEILHYFSNLCKIRPAQISIIRGLKSRGKTVQILDTNWAAIAPHFRDILSS